MDRKRKKEVEGLSGGFESICALSSGIIVVWAAARGHRQRERRSMQVQHTDSASGFGIYLSISLFRLEVAVVDTSLVGDGCSGSRSQSSEGTLRGPSLAYFRLL